MKKPGRKSSSGNRASSASDLCLRARNGSTSETGDAISSVVFQRCQDLGYDFVTRVAQNRNVLAEEKEEQEDPTAEHLKTLARSLPSQGVRVLTVPSERGRPEREALLNISWSQVTIQLLTYRAY